MKRAGGQVKLIIMLLQSKLLWVHTKDDGCSWISCSYNCVGWHYKVTLGVQSSFGHWLHSHKQISENLNDSYEIIIIRMADILCGW